MNVKFLIILSLLVFSTLIVSANNSTEFVNNLTEKINNDNNYLDFISSSKYNSVKLIAGEEVYYLEFNKGELKSVVEMKTDVTIEFTNEEFEEFMNAYEEEDVGELKNIILDKLPFRVKLNVLFQCMRTSWCRKMIF
ncbi:MAG: hypothetical protein QT05_C0001G0021 [archaeon GW2011_AR13]|nr:MAG: hypothetical protein QT05_C0001G0021 [archaeon GW2011_AR13]